MNKILLASSVLTTIAASTLMFSHPAVASVELTSAETEVFHGCLKDSMTSQQRSNYEQPSVASLSKVSMTFQKNNLPCFFSVGEDEETSPEPPTTTLQLSGDNYSRIETWTVPEGHKNQNMLKIEF